MVVGRVFVIILVVISILWIPIIQASQGSRLFDYIQSITSFLAPPGTLKIIINIPPLLNFFFQFALFM
jgi:solute carrier family 5 (sodium/glucose cotransporter), member 9